MVTNFCISLHHQCNIIVITKPFIDTITRPWDAFFGLLAALKWVSYKGEVLSWFCLILQITKQPLITKIMSPNPLQRKVLYKKREVPFCLNALTEVVKNRRKGQRSVVEKKILPWDLTVHAVGTFKATTVYVCFCFFFFGRSVDQNSTPDSLIGRLDPWGVWLMLKKGTDIVCANQYR